MSAYRSYGPGEYRPQFGGFSFFPPVIKNLIILNVAIYILQLITQETGFMVGAVSLGQWFAETFYLWPVTSSNFQIWQIISYMFLHGSFTHILFNMLMLWMFGMEVENTWGSRNFLIFYFTCGIAAAFANLFIAPIFAPAGPTIGASGGVYGVLVAFAMMFPNRYIYIYFLLPVKAKYLITVLVAFELYNGITSSIDGIAHMAHLGGAFVAAIWVLLDRKGVIDRTIGNIQMKSAQKFVQYQRGKEGAQDAKFYEMPRKDDDAPEVGRSSYQKTIDEILDKISTSGYSALTEDEKRMLLDASRRIEPGEKD